MASIQTGIELNDQFTNVIYGIINAVNLTVSTMEDMQHTMNADMDTSGIEGVHDEINQATMAMNELNQAMQNQSLLNTDPLVQPTVPSPAEPQRTPEWSNAPPSMDVFTDLGVERFQQEVQSANDMLNTLNHTQRQIEQTASGMDVLPDSAIQDINTIGQRIQAVQARIMQIENNPINFGTDTANAELEQLRSRLNRAVEEQNALNNAIESMDVSAANDAYLRLSQTVSYTERYIRDNVDEQGRFNQEINEGVSQADNLMNTIKGAVAAYVSLQTIGETLELSDELVQTTSRLNMMNDGLQTTDELVNMVYVAAEDARGSFSDMADVVARFGNNAGDAFSSSAEIVAFADLVQKQMTIAGASTTEASNAMLQLSQGLGSGVLRGDELNSIFEQAPNLIQNIADYLEVPIGEIREMASEGELTADIVKAAIFSATDEINAQFEFMPMTWGQIWQSMQNTALIAFRPVLQKMNDIANSEAFQTFVNGVIEALATLANVTLEVFEFMASCGQFVADNWSIVSPILYGIIAALAVYGAYLAIVKGMELASAVASAIHSVAMSAKIGIMAALSGTTMAATAAQMGYNGALYACPIVWIIMLVIALIAVIVMLCNWIAEATGAANSGIGIIVGALSVAVAFIGNIFVALINMVIDIFVVLWNFIAAFVNFFGNVFTDPVGAIANLFFDLVDFILGLLQTLAGAIDTLFGSNLAGAVQGWRNNLGSWVDETFGHGEEIMATVSGEEWHVDRFEYGEAWDAGVAVGDGISSAIDDFSFSDIFGNTDIPNVEDYTSQFASMSDSLDGISKDTGNISDTLEITDEDLKYLRDIAEREVIDRTVLKSVTIDMSGMTNKVENMQDLDGISTYLAKSLKQQMEVSMEGV